MPSTIFSRMRTFSYDDLAIDAGSNHIRMLATLPCRANTSRVRCELLVIDLDDDDTWPFTFYEALSYTWGSPTPTEKILLNSHTFEVRSNLESALRQLRVRGRGSKDTRYLWADALCINQDDVAERSQQVRKMKMIYERAEQVIAWIGPAANNSDQAMELMDFITDKGTRDDYITQYLQSGNAQKQQGSRALAMLLDRPYWRRVWIRQELAVAKDIMVMCGDCMLTWDTLESACDMLPTDLLDPIAAETSLYTSAYDDIVDIDSQREQVQADGHVSFEALLLHAKSCEATDSRDRVYGILNLAPGDVTTRMKPDYTLDKTDVYREATITAIETTRSLGILTACEDPEQKSLLPTWVPNLEDDWKANSIKRRMEYLQGIRLYSADNGNPAEHTLSPCKKRLSLKGIDFDTIVKLGGVWEGNLETADAVIGAWQALAMKAMEPNKTPWETFEAFWRTLTADQETEVCRMNFVSTFALSVARHIHDQDGGVAPRLDLQTLEAYSVNGKVSPYLDAVIGTVVDRQVFATSGGRIGIGNAELREGDAVCVLFGGSMPFALRRHSDGTYAVVNEIYVHGVMDGEITRSGKPTKDLVLQ